MTGRDRPAERMDLVGVRAAMENAPITEVERYRIEAILGRSDLTVRDCWDIRTALLAFTARRDGLHQILNSFPVAAAAMSERAG